MVVDKKEEAVDGDALTAVSAALQTLVDSEKVDDKALAGISSVVENLNEKTQKAILDLPAMQAVIQKVQESVVSADIEPGEYTQVGMFTFKKPYSLSDLYRVWGTEERFLAPRTQVVVTPGGWVFRLNEAITYDIPRDVVQEAVPEGHGYQLPRVVIQIINDSAQTFRATKRDTESERGFGAGVKFLGTGWAGKDSVVSAANAEGHQAPTD